MAKKEKSKFADLIEKIEQLNVLELNDLVKALEEKFGKVATLVAPETNASGVKLAEKSEYSVELTSSGSSAIQVIKVVKEATGLGLIEAKKMVDSVPVVIKEKVKKEEAEELKKKIESAGGSVNLK